jgi:hypothetical protein
MSNFMDHHGLELLICDNAVRNHENVVRVGGMEPDVVIVAVGSVPTPHVYVRVPLNNRGVYPERLEVVKSLNSQDPVLL